MLSVYLRVKSICSCACIVSIVTLGCFAEPQPAYGAQQCFPNGVCRAYLSHHVTPVVQRTPVWCWAASLSALFGALGHPVDQTRIVARYFPPPGITTGPPWVMRDALNTTWMDDNNIQFTVTSQITDLYSGPLGLRQVDNAALVTALSNEVPVFYGDATHAMLIVQADFVPNPGGEPQIVAGAAIDPYPYNLYPYCPFPPYQCQGPGFRPLGATELIGMFAAIATVH